MSSNIRYDRNQFKLVCKEGPILTFVADLELSGFAAIVEYNAKTSSGTFTVLPVIYVKGYKYYPYIIVAETEFILYERFDNVMIPNVLDKSLKIMDELIVYRYSAENTIQSRMLRGNRLLYDTFITSYPYKYECFGYSDTADENLLLLSVEGEHPVFEALADTNMYILNNASTHSLTNVFKRA